MARVKSFNYWFFIHVIFKWFSHSNGSLIWPVIVNSIKFSIILCDKICCSNYNYMSFLSLIFIFYKFNFCLCRILSTWRWRSVGSSLSNWKRNGSFTFGAQKIRPLLMLELLFLEDKGTQTIIKQSMVRFTKVKTLLS